MGIGNRIKETRKAKGISAETIAEKLDVAPSTIYRYESGDIMKVASTMIERIADALGVTPGYLMGWEDESDDDELWQIREDFRRNPELRTLHSLARKATPKQLRQMEAIIRAIRCEGDEEESIKKPRPV